MAWDRINGRFEGILGRSPAMVHLFESIERFAQTQSAVLIRGEKGSGKELLARTLHACGPRREGPFVALDCDAGSEDRLEAEIFGHESGDSRVPHAPARGLLELADGGTLFLDDVCALPLSLQAKLLRCLEGRAVRRVGSRTEIPADVRIIAATDRDIDAEGEGGRFRRDLLYRLDVLRLEVPPLRERPEDFTLLVGHFVQASSRRMARTAPAVTNEAMALLARHSWPGNVRELETTLERAVAGLRNGHLTVEDLPPELAAHAAAAAPIWNRTEEFRRLRAFAVRKFEQEYFRALLRLHGGDEKAARVASGLSRALFRRLSRHYGNP